MRILQGGLRSLCVHLQVCACANMYVNMFEYVCVCVYGGGGIDKSKDKGLRAELHGFFLSFGLSFFGDKNPVVSAV